MKLQLCLSTLIVFFFTIQIQSKLIIPPFNDTYCSYIKQLENGEMNIDYTDFRMSYIDSEQYVISTNELYLKKDSLINILAQEMNNNNPQGMLDVSEQLLEIDYTDMTSHNIQRQAYSLMGDTIGAKKHELILLGLLRSIIGNGDGQSCETAWPIIQLAEAYFIIQMIGAEIIPSDDMVEVNSICEPFLIQVGEQKEAIYFNTEKMRKGLAKIKSEE